jgi:hypothetical protein
LPAILELRRHGYAFAAIGQLVGLSRTAELRREALLRGCRTMQPAEVDVSSALYALTRIYAGVSDRSALWTLVWVRMSM